VEGRQLLNLILAKGEKVYTDPGKLVGKSSTIAMIPRASGGLVQALSRKLAGNPAMLTQFEASTAGGLISLAGILPGKVEAITLKDGEEFVAEHFAFLAAEDTVSFTVQPLNIGAAFFGGAGLLLQKFKGPGTIFIQAVGDTIDYVMDGSTSLEVEPGHIAGYDATLAFKLKFVDNIRSMMFANEGIFLATFTGRGRIILHSVSRFKLSSLVFKEGEMMEKKS